MDLRRKGDIGFRGPYDKGYGFDRSRLEAYKLAKLEQKKRLDLDLSEDEVDLELQQVGKKIAFESIEDTKTAQSMLQTLIEAQTPMSLKREKLDFGKSLAND